VTKEKREIKDFNSIHINGAGKIYIKQGTNESIIIETENRYLNNIKSEVSNNTLYLGTKDPILNSKILNYYVTVKNLQEIQTTGEASILSRDTISGEDLFLAIDGAGDVDLKIKVKQFKANIVGSSHVKLLGSAAHQIIEMTGAGAFDANKLQTKTTKVTINGAGNAKVNAISELDVKISGFGIVNYYGQPKITQEISGHGEIIPVG
jgi:hypothetical protein